MPVRNTDIADIFDAIADYLEVEGDNPFKIRAYRNASRTIRGLGPELREIVARGEELTGLPGIGKELAAKIVEVLETGTVQTLEKLKKKVPAGVIEMLKIAGLGPKRVKALYHELKIESLAALKQAAEAGRVQALPGFGTKTEQHIRDALEALSQRPARVSIALAGPSVEALTRYLQQVPGVLEVAVAGSFRRCKETVGDIDILVTAGTDSPVMGRFTDFADVEQVLAQGPTKSSIRLRSGLQVDLRLVAQECFGAALQYFTGSQAHNIAIRRIGRQRGLKINEYGVFRADGKVAGDTEESVYRALDLTWVPPELREDRGEIDAAREGRLPELIEAADIKGELHSHTTATDGRNSVEEMALAAKRCGLKYLAVTDHSQYLKMVHGLDERLLLAQLEQIDRLNAKLKGIRLLKGIEVEILEDGRLDLPDRVLRQLDLVIGSVHSRFRLPARQQTERILRAMDQRFFSILGHPSGRLIDERDPYEVDMAAVVQKAKERGCFLELNANPQRLDLTDTHCQMAKEAGVLVAINTDAHGLAEFGQLRYGIGQARRGWLEKKDVLNTRPLNELSKLLKQTMG
ncbi:MAG: DNA polymerase/3'-5' exonuclease PolX [Deltaproteobacteria bacterium]|nr:DNA polymerase/3'-5' exonuclease PolX [Deltaproteobacteria bacterium]